ncbi:MAG: hypothetical protein KU37_06775 [Sulfuricurvum sp. PC08-66]|nr:MAG: hypothetical protein KU37_06775 [Sulfuricurvum sp. PC08-66]
MATLQDYIYSNNLQWQATFNGKTEKYAYAYRGTLIITPGKVMSADKQLPPKATATQVVTVSKGEKMDFLACELSTFDFFEEFVAQYKSVLSPDGLYLLFVTDFDKDGKFVYEGLTFNAFSLDESSVWNELIEHADLDKGTLKKMSAEEKIDAVFDELKTTKLRIKDVTYEEAKALQNSSKKRVLFGAV